MASTITFEQHVQQNNERLVSIRQALQDPASFSSAAKELLEWVQDIRAFQKPFEENLISCLSAVSKLAHKEGFDLELGYRLLSNCCHRRDRLSPEHAALLEQWNEELGQALLHRHPPKSQIMDPSILHKNGVSPHQQQMMWSGTPAGHNPAGGSVSVVTTVYQGAVANGYPQQGAYDPASYAQQNTGQKPNGYPQMVPTSVHPGGGMAYRTAATPVASVQPAGPYTQPGYGVPRGTPTGAQYGAGAAPPGRAAMNAAKVAAAAVATATATAVAYENSQQIQSHQYDGQQMPMSYTPNGSQVYSQPHLGQMMQQPVGQGMVPGQPGYQNGRMRMASQVYPASHPSQMAQVPSQMGQMPTRASVPPGAPPQYPGLPASRMRPAQPTMMGPRMGTAPAPQYAPRGMQRIMRPVVYPGGNMMGPGAYPMQNPMMRQMSMPAGAYGGSRAPNGMVQGMNGTMPPGYNPNQVRMMEMKPDPSRMEEPRVTRLERDGCLLPIFRLEHNTKVTNHNFTLSDDVMQLIMQDPDSEIQLKCFHHDDKNHTNNWPHVNSGHPGGFIQPSVEVAVNGHNVPIQKVGQPLYIKRFCQPQENTLQITVYQCCCSHFFVLQRVSRPSVANLVRRIMLRNANSSNYAKCIERIKRRFSQNSSQGAEDIEQMSEKVSVLCPLGRNPIEFPARGANCAHIACFDLRNFLTIHQEKTHQWLCPICQQQLMLEDIEIDSYFQDILKALGPNRSVVDDVVIYASGKWEQVQVPASTVKQEPGVMVSDSGCPPAAKRFKSEPGGMNPACPTSYWNNELSYPASVGPVTGLVGSPQQMNGSVLSPYGQTVMSPAGAPAQITQRSASTPHPSTGGPGTPARGGYGPPTPVTPGMQNPPSVGTVYPGPRSQEPALQPTVQQQISAEGSVGSVAGSAPYTPASVGSAGSQKGTASGSEQQSQSGQIPNASSDQQASGDFDFTCDLFGDAGNSDAGLGLLSDHELLQYLDPNDFSAGQDFGSGPSQQGTGSSDQNAAKLPATSSSSLASDADDILASFLD